MNYYILVISALPFFFIAWITGNPKGALTFISKIVSILRWIRHYRTQKYGQWLAEMQAEEIRRSAAKEGIPKELVEEFIKKHKEEDIQTLGTNYVNKHFGKPSDYENFF